MRVKTREEQKNSKKYTTSAYNCVLYDHVYTYTNVTFIISHVSSLTKPSSCIHNAPEIWWLRTWSSPTRIKCEVAINGECIMHNVSSPVLQPGPKSLTQKLVTNIAPRVCVQRMLASYSALCVRATGVRIVSASCVGAACVCIVQCLVCACGLCLHPIALRVSVQPMFALVSI